MARSIRKFKETLDMRSGLLSRIRSHRLFSISLMGAALILVACAHIWQRVHVIRLVKETGDLRIENRQLVDDTKKILTEVAALSMASRIELCAADSLGLQRVSADRLYTITREQEKPKLPDQLGAVSASIKRFADALPVLSEAQAGAAELRPIKFESSDTETPGGGR
jgi:cell division protein FtsL